MPRSYVQEVQADTPIGWWRLGELSGTVAVDASGNGHTGQYQSGPTLGVPGAIANDPDTAVLFRPNQYVSIGDPTNSAYNVPSISVELWLATTSSVNMGIVGRWSANSGVAQYRVRLVNGVPTWQVLTLIGTSCSGGGVLPAGKGVIDGGYHHVVATFDATTQVMRLYIDGVQVASGTATGTSLCALTSFAQLTIATVPLNFDSSFNGTLDEVAIYGRALSATRVAAHYAAARNP